MNHEKSSDPLKDNINASFLETPPAGFTASVMNRLPAPAVITAYKPVITRFGWIFIGVLSIILAILGMFGSSGSNRFQLPQLPLNPLQGFSLETLFSNDVMPLLMLVALAGLFFVAADAGIRQWRNS